MNRPFRRLNIKYPDRLEACGHEQLTLHHDKLALQHPLQPAGFEPHIRAVNFCKMPD